MGALTTTVTHKEKFGKVRVHVGYSSAAATSGTVATGLSRIIYANVAEAVTNGDSPAIDTTTTAGTITLTKLKGSGNVYWMALGY